MLRDPRHHDWFRGASALLVCALFLCTSGCTSVPKGRYVVGGMEWKGVEQMGEAPLASCLVTKPREKVAMQLGLASRECGEPPFDADVPRLELWSWPWTTWPVYDPAIFEVDRRRIERWYRARGFYDARVVSVRLSRDGQPVADASQCPEQGSQCQLEILVQVEEGEPVRITEVEVVSEVTLPVDLRARLLRASDLQTGQRFDEASLSRSEQQLIEVLHEDGHARAAVRAAVQIDRTLKQARVSLHVTPGPVCTVGRVRVHGAGRLDSTLIEDVAALRPGTRYSRSALIDAERAVYALGTFAAVRIEPEEGDGDGSRIDLAIRVVPGRIESLRLGIGVMSGELAAGVSEERVAVPVWDLHLRAVYRNDDFLGGMRRLRIEERPRLIMLQPFPQIPASGPRPGNAVDVQFEQPRFIERRSVLFARANWDFGPDPYRAFFRHALASKVGVRRAFLAQTLRVSLALAQDVYEVVSDDADRPSSYLLPYLEQQAAFDLRDDVRRTRQGVYTAITLQQAVRPGYGSWRYLRVLPELRLYQALPLRLVLAQRLAFGALFIHAADQDLDPTSRRLGPQEYRLRGGGSNSNRGFAPGKLGAGVDGGIRRWEASIELRVPIGGDFGFVWFFDAGDVNAGRAVRLGHLNAATGFGLRYFTLLPIRVDLGWRIPGAQLLGGGASDVDLTVLPSAAHLTIGEAF